MPQGILPDQGIGDVLGYILSADIMGVLPWQLVLFVNDLTPDNSTTWDQLVEATWQGYNRVTLQRNGWTTPAVSEGCAVSYMGSTPYTWTVGIGSPQTNYGCAYYDQSSGVLRFVQRFDDGDIRPTTPGMKLSILPQFTLTSAACGMMTQARGSRAAQRRKGIRR